MFGLISFIQEQPIETPTGEPSSVFVNLNGQAHIPPNRGKDYPRRIRH